MITSISFIFTANITVSLTTVHRFDDSTLRSKILVIVVLNQCVFGKVIVRVGLFWYAHLSAWHITEHASKIDAIINRNGTNKAQGEKVVYFVVVN